MGWEGKRKKGRGKGEGYGDGEGGKTKYKGDLPSPTNGDRCSCVTPEVVHGFRFVQFIICDKGP